VLDIQLLGGFWELGSLLSSLILSQSGFLRERDKCMEISFLLLRESWGELGPPYEFVLGHGFAKVILKVDQYHASIKGGGRENHTVTAPAEVHHRILECQDAGDAASLATSPPNRNPVVIRPKGHNTHGLLFPFGV